MIKFQSRFSALNGHKLAFFLSQFFIEGLYLGPLPDDPEAHLPLSPEIFSVSSCSKSTVVSLLEVFFFFPLPCQFLFSSSCFQGKSSENPYPGQNCCSIYVDCFSLPATDKRQEGVGSEIRGCSCGEELLICLLSPGGAFAKSSVVFWGNCLIS